MVQCEPNSWTASRELGSHQSQGFCVISDCQKDILLAGKIYLNETYFPIMPKDESRKNEKHYRGLSRNKLCI